MGEGRTNARAPGAFCLTAAARRTIDTGSACSDSCRMARWQSGDAEDCKSSYTGSIPVRASTLSGFRLMTATAANGPYAGRSLIVSLLMLAALLARGAAFAQTQVPPVPLPAGMVERSLPFDGSERRFLVFQPARFRAGAPVLLVLHGGGQSARKMFRRPSSPHQSWIGLAEQEGFLLLAPNGTDPKSGDATGEKQHWYDLRNRWPVTNGPPDDVGFLAALAAWAVKERQADPARVYVAGASNGGMMTFRLLIERPDVFAAGAVFIATLPDRKLPEPAGARPILIAPGTEDPVIRWQGSELLRSGIVLRSAPDTLAYWLTVHGLAGQRPVKRYTMPDRAPDDGCRYEVAGWGGTPEAPLVEFWAIRGGGHWLPSTRPFDVPPKLRQWMGPRCLDVDGPTEAWAFLRQHRLP